MNGAPDPMLMHPLSCSESAGHGAQARRSARGFTLIEILVVIVIISIIIASVTIAVNVLGGDRQAEDQARRLWAVMQQAREEAELQGLDAGVYMAAGAYEFVRFDPRANVWQPITDDDFYGPREMPAGLRFRATLDGREIVLKPRLPTRTFKPRAKVNNDVKELGAPDESKEDPRKKDDKDNPPPQIVVLSSGEIMPFEVVIERDGAPALWRVVGSAENDLRLERRGPDQRFELIAQTNPEADDKDKEKEKSRGRK